MISRHSRPPRVEVTYEGLVTASDGHETVAIVRDVSAEGFRLEVCDELHVGEQIKLRVGKGPAVCAEVRWVRGSEIGGIFLNPQV